MLVGGGYFLANAIRRVKSRPQRKAKKKMLDDCHWRAGNGDVVAMQHLLLLHEMHLTPLSHATIEDFKKAITDDQAARLKMSIGRLNKEYFEQAQLEKSGT